MQRAAGECAAATSLRVGVGTGGRGGLAVLAATACLEVLLALLAALEPGNEQVGVLAGEVWVLAGGLLPTSPARVPEDVLCGSEGDRRDAWASEPTGARADGA